MNKKLYFNIVFYILGTCILAVLGVVVTVNFAKDARIFDNIAAKEQKSIALKPSPAGTGNQSIEEKTIQYRATDYGREEVKPKVTPRDYGESIPPLSKKTRVEVINYTGIKKLAEDMKTTLEASGFVVAAGNAKSNKFVVTEIIERNDKKTGEGLRKIIRAGIIKKEYDPKSKFDVTVILGDDYKP